MNDKDIIKLNIGEVVLISQTMENYLGIIILFLNNILHPNIENEDIDHQHMKLNQKTLGALKNVIAQSDNIVFMNNDLSVLEDAIKERNYVVHKFSRSNSSDFLTVKGRTEIINKLEDSKLKLIEANNLIIGLMQQVIALCGEDPYAMELKTHLLME